MNATPAVHDSDWPLGSHLQQSYELHPAFRFDAPAWQVDFDQLTTFNDAYALLSTHASRLDPRQRGKCRAQAVRSLAAVFGHFVSQAADRLEVQFATELHSQCLRLFDEELVLYSWKPISGALHFGAAAAQSHLLDLQRQHYYFGALPAACVQDMLAIGAADLRHLRETARRGRLQREDLSVNTGPTVRRIVGLLNREFRAQGALDALSAYMNRRMSVTGVALELSVPQATWWGGVAHKPNSASPDLVRAP